MMLERGHLQGETDMVFEINKHLKHFLDIQNNVQKSMDSIFAQINIKPIMFLGIGAIMALIGFLQIISNGISVLIWIFIMITGISALKYGMEKSGFKLPSEITSKFSNVVES